MSLHGKNDRRYAHRSLFSLQCGPKNLHLKVDESFTHHYTIMYYIRTFGIPPCNKRPHLLPPPDPRSGRLLCGAMLLSLQDRSNEIPITGTAESPLTVITRRLIKVFTLSMTEVTLIITGTKSNAIFISWQRNFRSSLSPLQWLSNESSP